MSRNFTSDKPGDCRYCYFWKDKHTGCELGGEEKCYYLVPDEPKEKGRCGGCPYGKHYPCIGFCLLKIMDKKKSDFAPVIDLSEADQLREG